MQLHYQTLGSGHPLIILHGLYGSGENWLTIGKSLSSICQVILVDQRNHGSSPHSETMNYQVLSDDLAEFMDLHEIRQATLLGHSMGGKAAMSFAAGNPGRVSRLIVADISPRSYLFDTSPSNHTEEHQEILNALEAVNLEACISIGDADRLLEPLLPGKRLRQFLLKNLKKNPDGTFAWKINIKAIRSNLHHLAGSAEIPPEPGGGYRQFPVLFLRGEKSHYILEPDLIAIRQLFPAARIVTIKNTGHWLHAEEPQIFAETVRKFLIT